MAITIILILLGLGLGAALDEPLIYALLGLALGRVFALDSRLSALDRELTRLREALAADWEQRNRTTGSAPRVDPISLGRTEPGEAPVTGDTGPAPKGEAATEPGSGDSGREQPPLPSVSPNTAVPPPANATAQPAHAPAGAAVLRRFRDWFNDGNLFVRVGILLLFLGVGFLIKYAVDQELLVFTVERRLGAVAIGAFVLLVVGWLVRRARHDYALLLQGAGIGLLYLVVYGAFGLYQLIGSGPAFAMLFLVGALATALAVVQNAPALAWFGFAGGFLAPVITSSGSDDAIALFSYYALLNAAMLAVAWFRSWRALNLLGFFMTWGVAVVWGVLRYEPSRFASTEPFLVLFFLFYVAIAVLYALRQPPNLRGWVDASLVFGTPLVAFTCQLELVRHIDYGDAWSAVTMGGFYLLLAYLTHHTDRGGLRLLSRAFLALGVVFLSVTVPFALGADGTAGAWALEGAGLVWIGARQASWSARAFGLLLQAGAALFFVHGYPYPVTSAFVNGPFLAAGMIAIAGALSSRMLDGAPAGTRFTEAGAAPWLLIWALAWWFGAGWQELALYYPPETRPAGLLLYALGTALLAEGLALRWPRGLFDRAATALPVAGWAAFATGLYTLDHPAQSHGWWTWPIFIGTCYLLLYRIGERTPHRWLAAGHLTAALLVAAVLEREFVWWAREQAGAREGWLVAAWAVVPVVLLQLVIRARSWPVGQWVTTYRVVAGGVLTGFLLIWLAVSIGSPGGSVPLPWVPLLNPLDLVSVAAVLTLWHWWRSVPQRIHALHAGRMDTAIPVVLGGSGFLWINLALLRAMHHWTGVPWEADALFESDAVQTALAVLWGVSGVSLLLVAKRLGSRTAWVAGATVIAAVVVKLFLVDLAASGTVERIVSFLVVGGLLVAIGWFSPLPPRREPDAALADTARTAED